MAKSFDDFKKEIDLVDFAVYHGYDIIRADGMKWPSLVHRETGDSIIINPDHRMYREKHNTDAGGNILRFIKDRADTIFAKFNTEKDPSKFYMLLNNVCYDYLNISPEKKKEISNYVPQDLKMKKAGERNFFSLDTLNVRPLDDSYYLIKQRMIDPKIIKDPLFAPKLVNQQVNFETGTTLTNTGFIYTTSILNDTAVGLEVRNSQFKSHSEGSDRSSGVGFSALNDNKVKNLIVGESFIDQMSYHQLHGLPTNIYGSTGGQLTAEQLTAILNTPEELKNINKLDKDFKFTLAFDNDMSGHVYDFQFIRRLGSESSEPLAITRAYASNNINNNLSFLFFNTAKLEQIKPDLIENLDKINALISKENSQADQFKIQTKVNDQGDYKIEFPKNPKYMELFNNVLIKTLKLENILTIHKAIKSDFNDDLKAINGRKVEMKKEGEPQILDFSKLNKALKI
ncbi:toprim domain-containing protein [Pedobacter jeongneungensis]|uniref:toprim domain-containing protein n=1 Tax=Pedobacter jeongneungensis TaxID=947309 RepID=UPI000468EF45|nr:toprim domain-containing protein [Pedobacter jeongneungensis]